MTDKKRITIHAKLSDGGHWFCCGEGEEFSVAATHGEWEVLGDEGIWAAVDFGGSFVTMTEDLNPADAAAIVAAHNALPQLVAAVRAVLTEAEALDRFADAVPYAATGSYDDGRKRAQANAAARIRGAVAAALGAEVTGR